MLAYSGGLDTSFCIPFLKEKYGADVITVTVDTGGFTKDELEDMKVKSKKLGASKHITIDARSGLFNDFITYLIKGNVLKGDVYPLSVGAERVLQATEIVKTAREENAATIAHGSTPAGNDQVRFDVAFKVLAPEIDILAPVREFGITREEETKYLTDTGVAVNEKISKYSINTGLWGTTIGGGETHDSWEELPEEAYTYTIPISETPDEPEIVKIRFQKGVPVSLNDETKSGLEIVEELNMLGGIHGVGREIHIGETIMGIKGRIAFEAPGPMILIKAHKELEKIVLTKWQQYWKDQVSEFFGILLHEALYFDPVVKDIKAFLNSSQEKVTGDVRIKLFKGNINTMGCKSPYSLMDRSTAVYGEGTTQWTGLDAQGFCNIYGMPGVIAKRVEKKGEELIEN